MFKKFNLFRSRGSNFSAYYGTLARDGITGIPTADEARRDYREVMRNLSRSPWS